MVKEKWICTRYAIRVGIDYMKLKKMIDVDKKLLEDLRRSLSELANNECFTDRVREHIIPQLITKIMECEAKPSSKKKKEIIKLLDKMYWDLILSEIAVTGGG